MSRDYWSQRVKLKARIGLSAAVLTACCVIVLRDYPVDVRTWAFFTFGLVIAYWLR